MIDGVLIYPLRQIADERGKIMHMLRRDDSPTRQQLMQISMGETHYVLVKIPPGIWNGFKGLGVTPSIVANCATEPHDPNEIVRMDPSTSKIPHDWAVRHG